MRGSSGARIVFENGHVVKMDTDLTNGRVIQQGNWLMDMNRWHPRWTVLPKVTHIHARGYVMEHLAMVNVGETPATSLWVFPIASALAQQVWAEPAVVAPHGHEHHIYVKELAGSLNFGAVMDRIVQLLPSDVSGIHRCLTHGDPIVDNLGFRGTEVVLIDPIPATHSVPDLLCSDVGRLIQSAVGYEAARYGGESYRIQPYNIARYAYMTLGVDLTDTEFMMCLYFSVIHALRGLRSAHRVAPDRAQRVSMIVDGLAKELLTWMR